MHLLFVENPEKIKKAVSLIENKTKIRISLTGNRVVMKGSELNAFLVEKIIKAVDFGFDAEDAVLLLNENYVLEFINLKDHTRKRNLEEVRGRVIGIRGRAKKTIEELSGAVVAIRDNEIGIIVGAEQLDNVCQAFVSIIKGAKHANVFSYLERGNRNLKKIDSEDLGLKEDLEE